MVGRAGAAKNLAFVVPAAFSCADVGTSHTEAFFGGDTAAMGVEEDVRGGLLEGEARREGFGVGLAEPS